VRFVHIRQIQTVYAEWLPIVYAIKGLNVVVSYALWETFGA